MDTRPLVMLVEDDPVSQAFTQAVLERKGYQVQVVSTGMEALATFECDPLPSAVILDLHLPDKSGSEVCRALRVNHPARTLPILFLSSDADIQHRAEGLGVGGSDYLSKPVNEDELALRLGTHLALASRTQEVERVERDWNEVFNALTDAVTLLDQDGHIVKCNQAMAKLVGIPQPELYGLPCHQVMHRLEHRIESCPFARMLETSTFQQAQEELNGRWVEITVEPLFDHSGGIRGGVHRIRDIHDRVTAEEARRALLTSERRWRTMAEVRARLAEARQNLPLPDLLTVVLDEVSVQVESPIGFYHFYDEGTGNLTLQQWSTRTREEFCQAEGQGEHYHVSRAGVWVDCLRERRAVIHNDYQTLPHRKGLPPGHAELIRELVVPVFRSGRIVALLGVGNKSTPYTEQDLEAVQYLADLTWDLVERKALETRQAEEKAKFEALFKLSPEGIFLMNREPPEFQEVNPCFAAMLGYSTDELAGQNALNLGLWPSAADREFLKKALEANGCIAGMECQLRRRDGQTFWAVLNLAPVLFGGVSCQIGTVHDISLRKKLELQRDESQANLDALFRSTGDFVWSVDAGDRLVVFNQALAHYFETCLGFSPWLGSLPEDGLPPDRAMLWRGLYSRCRTEGAFELEYSIADGRFYAFSVNPVRHADGSVGVSVFGRDVSAWRQAEEELARQRDAFEALFEHLESGFSVYEIIRNSEGLAVDHRLVLANAGFEQHTGLKRENELGRRSAELSLKIPPDILRKYYEVVDTGVPLVWERFNTSLLRHWDVCAYRPAQDRLALIFTDISTRKRLEEEVENSRARLISVVESTEDLVWSVDEDFRLHVFNGAFERHIRTYEGLRPHLGDPADAFLATNGVAVWKSMYKRALEEGAFHAELPLSNGRILELNLNPIIQEGRSVGVAVFARDISEAHRKKREFERLREMIQQMQRIARIGAWELDLIENRLRWSEGVYDIYELAPEDYTPEPESSIQFYAPESKPIIRAALQRAIELGEPFEVEVEFVTARGGRRIWVKATGEVEQRDGRTIRVFGSFLDIDAERKAILALAQNERRLKAIFDTTAEGLVLLDKETLAILDANPAFCRTYGYSLEELITKTATDMSAEPDQTAKATRGPATKVRGRLHQKKDGTVFQVDLTAGTFEDQGRLISVVSSRDITDQMRAIEALQEMEERLELVLDGAQLGFWDWDIPTGRVTRNARWAAMLGYTLEEVESSVHQWTDLHHPDDRNAAWTSIQDHLEGRTSEHRIQYRMLAKDGTYRWILDQAQVMKRDEGGHPVRMCGTHTDITALKQVESALREHQEHLEELVRARTAQLESANQELEAFSYSVSHDLRAPLRAIAGYSEAMEEDCRGNLDERSRTYLDRIQKAGQQMGSLIDDLLRLSRVGRQDCHMSPVDLSRMAEDLCKTLSIRHSGRAVSWEVEPGISVLGDESLLHIALENLLANAWKFTSRTESPQVRIERGNTGEMQIRDNGAGFPGAKTSQLFTPFRRLHHESEFAGTGLGLAIVHRVISRHGGTITAEGHPGRGACFTIRIPGMC